MESKLNLIKTLTTIEYTSGFALGVQGLCIQMNREGLEKKNLKPSHAFNLKMK